LKEKSSEKDLKEKIASNTKKKRRDRQVLHRDSQTDPEFRISDSSERAS